MVSAQVHKDGFCLGLQLINKEDPFPSPQGWALFRPPTDQEGSCLRGLFKALSVTLKLKDPCTLLSRCWHASVAITLSSVTSSLKPLPVLFCGVRTLLIFLSLFFYLFSCLKMNPINRNPRR